MEISIGSETISVENLKELLSKGERLNIRVIGRVKVESDVTIDLIDEAVDRIQLAGILSAPKEIKDYINRTKRYSIAGRESYYDRKRLGEKSPK